MDKNIIKHPQNEEGFFIEWNGITYKVPEGFRVFSDKGIIKEIFNKNGDIVGFETISYRTVLINSILENHDTEEEKIDLIFCDTGRKLIVEKSDLYSTSKIVKLANKGMQVNSNNAKDWINFLSKYEALNLNIIPRKKTINRLGWINSDTFIPYNKNEYEIDVNDSTLSWIQALDSKGSLVEWVKTMSELRKENSIFRTVLATSFSAPLLHITGTRSFVLYNWAMSKRRKNSNCILCYVSMGISRKFKSFI